jgi:hypothetical protein
MVVRTRIAYESGKIDLIWSSKGRQGGTRAGNQRMRRRRSAVRGMGERTVGHGAAGPCSVVWRRLWVGSSLRPWPGRLQRARRCAPSRRARSTGRLGGRRPVGLHPAAAAAASTTSASCARCSHLGHRSRRGDVDVCRGPPQELVPHPATCGAGAAACSRLAQTLPPVAAAGEASASRPGCFARGGSRAAPAAALACLPAHRAPSPRQPSGSRRRRARTRTRDQGAVPVILELVDDDLGVAQVQALLRPGLVGRQVIGLAQQLGERLALPHGCGVASQAAEPPGCMLP